ncbi:MAG: DUF6133 family protein [Clostridia bacterium]
MNKLINKIKSKFLNKRAEGYINSGIKILIAVVVGAVLLGGLIFIFQTNILPKVRNRIINIGETKTSNTTPNDRDKFFRKLELISLTTSNTRLVRGEKAKYFITIRNNSDYDITYEMNARVWLSGTNQDVNDAFYRFVADAHSEKTIEIETVISEYASVGKGKYRVFFERSNIADCSFYLTWNADEDELEFCSFPNIPPIE